MNTLVDLAFNTFPNPITGTFARLVIVKSCNEYSLLVLAIALLQDKPPGTFVIRDSQSYTGAFGLAVKVEVPPMHVIQNQNKDFGETFIFAQ